ncbi:cysteine proteinase, partial [Ramicandelaber brevisporus]
MKSYIKCINVDYESSRTENFYDIQLIVKGCLTLGDSFRAYTEVEVMDEDNQYRSDDYGLQDAHKGVLFEHFPPVLHLQLKRFEYDFERDRMVKNNDRFEFPEEIDLTEFLTADSAQINANNNYVLHGVLVHAGSLQSGHYYAMIKPEKNGRWIKFNDDHVRPVPANIAIDDNYGGMEYNVEKTNSKGNKVRAHANAYMLVYIREEALDEVLAPVTIDDIPQHLQNAMAEQEAKLKAQLEQQERDRLRREESKRNMTIR